MKALYTIIGIIVGLVLGIFIPKPIPKQTLEASLTGKTGAIFDRAYLKNMIAHHEEAIQMSQNALANAQHTEIKNLAQDMIYAEQGELQKMKEMQTVWFK